MSLSAGTRLGPYEVLALLGAAGSRPGGVAVAARLLLNRS